MPVGYPLIGNIFEMKDTVRAPLLAQWARFSSQRNTAGTAQSPATTLAPIWRYLRAQLHRCVAERQLALWLLTADMELSFHTGRSPPHYCQQPCFGSRSPRREALLQTRSGNCARGDAQSRRRCAVRASVAALGSRADSLARFTAFHGEENWGVARKLNRVSLFGSIAQHADTHRTADRILTPAFGPVSVLGMFDDMFDILSQMILKWERYVRQGVK